MQYAILEIIVCICSQIFPLNLPQIGITGHASVISDIGEKIQYEIDEVVITRDERLVIYSNIYTNDIVFLDFNAKKKASTIRGKRYNYHNINNEMFS